MAKEKRSRNSIPFWLQIMMILLAGALVSLGIWLYANSERDESGNDIKDEVFTVTFSDGDGTVISQEKINGGAGIIPPIPETEDVFRGWTTALNSVQSDIETHPSIYKIVENNLFYFNSAYVVEGENFLLPLRIGGNVNVTEGQITMEYDPEVLTYVKADCEDFCKVEKGEAGTLIIKLDSDTAITAPTQLAELTFRAEKKDAYSTRIDLKSDGVFTMENGEKVSAENATINNEIYFIKEGE